jgi:hypothetical protein
MILIPIPDSHPNDKWDVYSEGVIFTFLMNVDHFQVDHPEYFDPKIPSGGFRLGNAIGPYRPVASAKGKTVVFKYDPDKGGIAGSHTILIGN